MCKSKQPLTTSRTTNEERNSEVTGRIRPAEVLLRYINFCAAVCASISKHVVRQSVFLLVGSHRECRKQKFIVSEEWKLV